MQFTEYMDRMIDYADAVFHLARLGLAGRAEDVQLYVRRLAKAARDADPALAARLQGLLSAAPNRSSPLRGQAGTPTLPVDTDSRLELIRVESAPQASTRPIFDAEVGARLAQVVRERQEQSKLEAEGLSPTRSLLLTGAPGVGKTLAARWLAGELGLPLLVLDLSAVMSSFLGRTGNNLRFVLDYAKSLQCVLLLDELDAIAKRRDDATEIGELKRLVTVLLQEIDGWPEHSILVAATNHPELLDPAVWRRFDLVLEFPMPGREAVSQAVRQFTASDSRIGPKWQEAMAAVLQGVSFSNIQRSILELRRAAALGGDSMEDEMVRAIRSRIARLPWEHRVSVAQEFHRLGLFSQRTIHDLTGISREKIRKDARIRGNADDGEESR
jgi:SpoVK/Ycf46/Vps4 family AAA+-type ATPase